jgi:hypothetical protein
MNAVRYGSRYDSQTPGRQCLACAKPLISHRARYCDDACKQRAYRLRQLDSGAADVSELAADLKRRRSLAAHTIYECPSCEARFLGERRCDECNCFCRALGPGGACVHCGELLLLAELLD